MSSSSSITDSASVTSAIPICVGELHLSRRDRSQVSATRRLYAGHDLIVGRDRSKCQWVVQDPQLSAKHLRVYTIIFDNEEEDERETLVYAEDTSQHGTFWNGSYIGKGNGGFLLSHGDKLRLSSNTSFQFTSTHESPSASRFDLRQEREMSQFHTQYVITDRLLGSGSFGQVFMAIEQRMRAQVACKVINLRKFRTTTSNYFSTAEQTGRSITADSVPESQSIKMWAERQWNKIPIKDKLQVYYREVEILSQLSHPNIIGLHKVYVTDNTIYMMQDLITAGDLFSYLESKTGVLLEVEAAVIIRQIVIAVQFLHERNIVHRDLKPENIMMTSLAAGCRIVLTDFGAARRLSRNQRMTSVVGSEQYAAPELKPSTSRVVTSTGYTKAVDMWAVGAVTVVLLTGGSAFSDPLTGTYSPVLARNCKLDSLHKSTEWQHIRPRPRDFINSLLVFDQQKRMTAQKALMHCWFSNEMHNTDFEELYQRTIKNWRPRMTKGSVIEVLGSSTIRHMLPPENNIKCMKRAYREKQSIDSPYKPFPRKMYATLWPVRRSLPRVMSDEVKLAIAEKWTVRSVEAENREPAASKLPRAGTSLQRAAVPHSLIARSASIPPQAVANTVVPPFRSSSTTSLKLSTERTGSMERKAANTGEAVEMSFSEEQIGAEPHPATKTSTENANPSNEHDQGNRSRPYCLRRRSSRVHESDTRKRRRDMTFDPCDQKDIVIGDITTSKHCMLHSEESNKPLQSQAVSRI